jgi:hypothetical protein
MGGISCPYGPGRAERGQFGGEIAVDLIGRGEDQAWGCGAGAHRLEHVKSSEGVDSEIRGRIREAVGRGFLDGVGHRVQIPDISRNVGEMARVGAEEVAEIFLDPGT